MILFWYEIEEMKSFGTLVAIVAGLRLGSLGVPRDEERVGRGRVNVYNLRILKDITSFADSADDFKHIRRAVAQPTDPKLATGVSEEAPRCAGKLGDEGSHVCDRSFEFHS